MKKIIWISIITIFLWSCKGSSSATTNPQLNNGQSSSTKTSQVGTQNNPVQTESNSQNTDSNNNSKYKSGSQIQNTSIKKQYPAAK